MDSEQKTESEKMASEQKGSDKKDFPQKWPLKKKTRFHPKNEFPPPPKKGSEDRDSESTDSETSDSEEMVSKANQA